jgi:hypothetical protein
MSVQAQTTPTKSQGKTKGQGPLKDIDAFVFDVFGTVVDWRTNVVKEVEELGKKHGVGAVISHCAYGGLLIPMFI